MVQTTGEGGREWWGGDRHTIYLTEYIELTFQIHLFINSRKQSLLEVRLIPKAARS